MAKTTFKPSKANRRGHHKLSISTPTKYRLVITFAGQARPRLFDTSDLARARSVARRNARRGAHVDFQRHDGWGRFTTTNTYAPEPGR